MKQSFYIHLYDNKASEVLDITSGILKTTYNTKDIVYMKNGRVVKIIQSNGALWQQCDNPDTTVIDAIQFQDPYQTSEAKLYAQKKQVLANLEKDPNYYDEFLAPLINKEGQEPIKITRDIVYKFFDIPTATRNIKVSARKTSVCSFDAFVNVEQNPALQDAAMGQLDALLDNKSITKLCPWSINYDVGISRRYFSGDPKECQDIIQKWFKACQSKFGKNLTIEGLRSS